MKKSLPQFADRMMDLMPRLARGFISRERNYFSRGLITLPQVWTLRTLAEKKSCTMRDLAFAIQMKASTATGLMDRLVKLGLAKRVRDKGDRRTVIAAITPKGARILDDLHEEQRKSLMHLFRHVSAQERSVYLDILDKIVQNLSDEK